MKTKKNKKSEEIIRDDRFNFYKDPRFKPLVSKQHKVKVDERFTRMFTDDDFSVISRDPFGNKLTKRRESELDLIYDGLESSGKQEHLSEQETTTFSDTSDTEGSFNWDKNSADSSTENEDDSDLIYSNTENNNKDSVWENNPLYITGISEGQPTNRLAIMGLDWDNINADDIYVVLSSFLSSSSTIQTGYSNPQLKKISIYPSQFGIERMEYENTNGPKIGNDQEYSENNQKYLYAPLEEEMTEEDYEAIRKYQVEKSLYYYAIVECDKTSTAIKLYDELDGMEADFCIDTVEIRFVPNELVEFPYQPTSVSTCIPIKYKRPEFFASAMKHSRPSLTWDDTPIERVKFLRKKFTPEELLKSDFDAYLGSSDTDEETNKVEINNDLTLGGELLNKNLSEMRDILLGDAKDIFNENLEENSELDKTSLKNISEYEMNRIFKGKDLNKNQVEIEFNPDLENLSMELIAKGKEKWENKMDDSDENNKLTPWQLYLNKRKQKRRERKMQLRERIREQKLQRETSLNKNSSQILDNSSDKLNINCDNLDDTFNEDKDDEEDRHFDMKKIILKENSVNKVFSKKRRELIKNATSDSIQNEFSGAIHDPRISKIFTDPDFAIDPTNPVYRPTDFNKKLLHEKRAQKIKRNSILKSEKTNLDNKEFIIDDNSFKLINRKKSKKN